MGKPIHPIYRRKLPQTHGERGGEAGERSPHAPKRVKDWSYMELRRSTLPWYVYAFCSSVFGLLISGTQVGYYGWKYTVKLFSPIFEGDLTTTANVINYIFLALIVLAVVSGILLARAIYNSHSMGERFLDSIKNKVYDPEERRNKWQ